MDSLARVRDSLIANYVPEFIGFQISHKFKCLSTTGFPVEGDMTFFLDSMILHIPQYKDNKWNVWFIYDTLTQKYKPNYDNIRLSN